MSDERETGYAVEFLEVGNDTAANTTLTPTATGTATATATTANATDGTVAPGQPGFGLAVAFLAFLLVAVYARRRR